MFDIGFWEIIVIAIVALLVVGPDRLPGLIRETARWAAKIRRFVVETKREIEREVRLDDIEKDLTARITDLEDLAENAPDKEPEQKASDQGAIDKQAPAQS